MKLAPHHDRCCNVLLRNSRTQIKVYYLETFIDPERSRGTCYRAANWIALGLTTGCGKADMSNRPNRPLKQVLAYPLDKRFRRLLQQS